MSGHQNLSMVNLHDRHLNLHYNLATTTIVRIIYLMLNDLSSVIIIIAARLKPELFDLPGQHLVCLETADPGLSI